MINFCIISYGFYALFIIQIFGERADEKARLERAENTSNFWGK